MLKIKDNVDLKELEKYGFNFKYDCDTGEITEIYKYTGSDLGRYGLHFKKAKPNIISMFFSRKYQCWIVDTNILWFHRNYDVYEFDFDILYDLIKDGLVEKVEE